MRLYAPAPGSNKYQVYFKAPVGDGEQWKRGLRRANSEAEARKIFEQAEAALDTDKETPAGADVRASRTIRMLGEEYLKDSIERGKQPRTMEQRISRLNAGPGADVRHRPAPQAKATPVRLPHQGRKAATDSTRPSRSSIARTSANVAGGLPRESAIR